MTDEITLDAPETRLERFLAAAAGVDGITLDEPVTRIEKYLYKIAQGSGGSSDGGVLVVHADMQTWALDKTWNEIDAVEVAVIVYSGSEGGATFHVREFVTDTAVLNGNYYASTSSNADYVTDSADGYPVRQQ